MLAAVDEAYDTRTRQPDLRSSDGYRTESEIPFCAGRCGRDLNEELIF